jgi:PhnB protein
MAVKAIPEGQSALSPYLVVSDAAATIEFYRKAFGATETFRLQQPDGRIGHAELRIGGALLMLADEFPEMGLRSPKSMGDARSPVMMHLYVEDVDAVYRRAIALGAVSVSAPADQFYGDRNAQVKDPSGHSWDISTHKEDVAPAEMQRRMDAMIKR